MSSDNFDYGERLEDGQYENHPTLDEGDFKKPIRIEYIHNECGETTRIGQYIAESFARDPDYYTKTFCVHCGDYYPVGEFRWAEDGETVGT